MVQCRGCSRLAAESLKRMRIVGKLFRKELQHDKTASSAAASGKVHKTNAVAYAKNRFMATSLNRIKNRDAPPTAGLIS
jgi:hypothetical protein